MVPGCDGAKTAQNPQELFGLYNSLQRPLLQVHSNSGEVVPGAHSQIDFESFPQDSFFLLSDDFSRIGYSFVTLNRFYPFLDSSRCDPVLLKEKWQSFSKAIQEWAQSQPHWSLTSQDAFPVGLNCEQINRLTCLEKFLRSHTRGGEVPGKSSDAMDMIRVGALACNRQGQALESVPSQAFYFRGKVFWQEEPMEFIAGYSGQWQSYEDALIQQKPLFTSSLCQPATTLCQRSPFSWRESQSPKESDLFSPLTLFLFPRLKAREDEILKRPIIVLSNE